MRIYALQPAPQLERSIEARLLRTLKPHTGPVVTSTVDASSSLLATGGADGVVKVWDLRRGFPTHTFHGHSRVISALHFFIVDAVRSQSANSKKRKSNALDGTIEEPPQDQETAGYRLASGGEDGKIRIWDLHRRKAAATLDAHTSVVRSLDYSPDQDSLLSGSRDKTVVTWDAQSWRAKSTVAVLEGVESVGFVEHGHYFYTGGETGRLRMWNTERGSEVTEEQAPGSEMDAIVDVLHSADISFLLSIRADQTLILHSLAPLADHTPQAALIPALPVLRRISGTHDEVIDLAYIGPERNVLAIATNEEHVRLISLGAAPSPAAAVDDTSYFGSEVALLKGHADIIITMSIDWSGHWLATGAKDNVAKLWRVDPATNDYICYATFTGHAESIGAVALPSATPPPGSKEHQAPLDSPPKFLITGSQDKTVKRWDIPNEAGKLPRAAYTRKAHDKDINAIATSYTTSSTLFASASQDRTVKIWDIETGEAIGVLRGHKRGVWSVSFSPLDIPALSQSESGGASSSKGMVVTGSGDKTVRIWSLSDFSCLRTFEGHDNSVLKVIWLPPSRKSHEWAAKHGVQVASAAGDGLVKVWDAQGGECAATLDNHTDRVWALAVKPPPVQVRETIPSDDVALDVGVDQQPALELVSGSADSTLTFWHDTTAISAQAATSKATQRVEQHQDLQNYIRASNYREAIVLALQLNHPKRLLDLFSAVANGPHEEGSFLGRRDVDEVIASLSDSQLWSLLTRLRDWNANARTHNVAEDVLYAILHLIPQSRLLSLRRRRKTSPLHDELASAMAELSTSDKSREGLGDVVDGLKAYTERHRGRLEVTASERFVLLWAMQQMDDVDGPDPTNGLINGHHRASPMLVNGAL